jgi:competence protein ComEC
MVFADLGTKGESILVIFPNNNTMLVDGGMPSSYETLESILKQHAVSQIDVMVGTHADQDHIAGLIQVLDDPDFEVEKLLISHVPSNTATYRKFLEKTAERGIIPQTVFSDHVIETDDLVRVRILSPPVEGIPEGPNASLSNSNALVILMEYGNISFLLTSDATHMTEKWLIDRYDLDIDIMNGPHHGSKYSSTDEFIDKVTPQLVIFSADSDNEYGHPHKETIERYTSRNINYYQTGTDGNIIIKTDGIGCSLVLGDVEHPCYAGVQTVPEFPLSVLLLAASVAFVLIANKYRHGFNQLPNNK